MAFKEGHESWNKGKKLSKKHKEKIRDSIKGNKYPNRKKIIFTEEHKENLRKPKLTTINMRGRTGEKSHSWKGGITPLNKLMRESSKMKIWRNLVFLRDNFTCQNKDCGFCNNKIGVYLHPHHIKPMAEFPELMFNINNGITYCAEFHLKSGLHKNIQGRVINGRTKNRNYCKL